MIKTEIFTKVERLPTEKEDPEFWSLVGNPDLNKCIVLLILNELRRYPVEGLTDQSTRSVLAKLKGYQELIDLMPAMLDPQKELVFTSDDPFKE